MVGETVKSNIRERVDAFKTLINSNVAEVRESAELLKNLRPAQAAINLPQGFLNNTGEFVRKQLEITRRVVG